MQPKPKLIADLTATDVGGEILVVGALHTEQEQGNSEEFLLCPGGNQTINRTSCIRLEISEDSNWNLSFTDDAIVEVEGRLLLPDNSSTSSEAFQENTRVIEVHRIDHVYPSVA